MYNGQIVDWQTGDKREEEYADQEKSMVMVWLGKSQKSDRVDAHRDETGRLYEDYENTGRYLNNKGKNPNCELVYKGTGKNIKLSLRARRDIAAGSELKWFYNDGDSKIPWMHE